jgi:hypothetical protein
MLLEALAACAGEALSAVATALGIQIREGSVLVEGDLDFQGTLSVAKEALLRRVSDAHPLAVADDHVLNSSSSVRPVRYRDPEGRVLLIAASADSDARTRCLRPRRIAN